MKKVSRSRVFGWFALGLLGAALAQSCGAAGDPARAGDQGGTGGIVGTDSGNDAIIQPPDPGGAGGESPYNPLCGVVDCVPDQPNACAPTTGGNTGDGGPPSGGTTTGDGGRGMGGAPDGGRSPGGAPSDGGVGGEGGQGASANAGGSAGLAGTPGRGGTSGTGPIENSCQVRPKQNEPRAQCVPAGPGDADAPCLTGSDCAPGLACVEEGDAGQCRPYCCEADSCPERTHCIERTLFGLTQVLEVPVCVPAVDCDLAEPPCLEGETCTCPPGLACMVVGTDRTTTCVEPGRGRVNPVTGEGQDCPCAWGFVCSQATNRCVELCQTAAPEVCATGMCQASVELPPGWGVCVGVPRPDGG
jgi:hypothetical protein